MDQDLSAELAQLEAQLAQDDQLRNQQQQTQQQQPQTQQQTQAPEGSGFVFATTQGAPQSQSQSQSQMNPFAQAFQPSSATTSVNPFADGPFTPNPSVGTGFSGIGSSFPAQPAYVPGGASAASSSSAAAAAHAHTFSKDTDGRSIFVGNLPKGENGGPTVTPEELTHFFSECGPILNCTVLKDRTTGELKGTAYIEFQTYGAMGRAIDTKNNADFKGSTIIVTKKRSNFRPERARGGRGGRFERGRGGGHAMDPFQAITALMGLMSGAMGGRGGFRGTHRGRGGRGRGSGGRGGNEESGSYSGGDSAGNSSGSFQPF